MLCADDVSAVRYSSFRPLKHGTTLAVHEGGVWDVAASRGGSGGGVHGLVISGGADGVCCVISVSNRISAGSKVHP